LRTVYYSLSAPQEAEDSQTESTAGLVRRELDFETPVDFESTADLNLVSLATEEVDAAMSADTISGGTSDQAQLDPLDDTLVLVPEVVGLEFRYFDGNGWVSQWDSLQRKSLPAAVEVILEMQSPTPSDDSPDSRPEGELAAEGTALAPSSVHRLIVDLPTSPAYRKPKPPRTIRGPATVVRPPRPPVRRITPRRWPTNTQTMSSPEEWIRTRSQ
jgi:hypothetical protein